MSDDYDTGIYCKHWLEPGICVECAKELCDFAALAAENARLRECLANIVGHEVAYDRGDAYAATIAREALSRKAAP